MRTEPQLFKPPQNADELCHPSGDLRAKLAAHLHNPSFTVHDLRNHETADETNPCIWILLQSGITSENSLIFDHLARRDNVDGYKEYTKEVLACHENIVLELRKRMGAYVEIVFGGATRDRMQKILNLEPFPLWGRHQDTPLYLEWHHAISTEQDYGPHISQYRSSGVKQLKRFILFAHHPQAFTFPWGPRSYGKYEDLSMEAAFKLTQITLKENFYSTLKYISKTEHLKLVYKNNSDCLIATDHPDLGVLAPNTMLTLPAHSSLPETELPLGGESKQELDQNKDDTQHQAPVAVADSLREKTLRRQARGSGTGGDWRRLIREAPENDDLDLELEIWCQRCKENTRISPKSPYSKGGLWPVDSSPSWTKGQRAKYIEVKPKCLNCAEVEGDGKWLWKRFVPVNDEIPSLDMDQLRKWAKRHSFLSLDVVIDRLDALRAMPRDRVQQNKPGFGKRNRSNPRLKKTT